MYENTRKITDYEVTKKIVLTEHKDYEDLEIL